MAEPPDKPIHYCYQCGTRLRADLESCWYCGVPVHRQIRLPRRCPFCAEPIRREAVKCPSCGEFLDGRERVDARPVQQMIVIDKDVLRAMSDLHLIPGSPVPDAARHVLDERTIRAIEENRPHEIEEPGVRVLPAPSVAPMLPEPEPDRTSKAEIVRAPKAQPPATVSGESKTDLVRRAGPLVPVPPGSAGPSELMRRPERQLPVLAGRRAADSAKQERIVDVEAADVYRICNMCQTEILATDNFCFHCGTKYHKTAADDRREALERRRRRLRALKVAVLLLVALFIAAGAYLYVHGYLSLEGIKAIGQAGRYVIKGDFGKGVEQFKAFETKAAAAEECRENLRRMDAAVRAVAEKEKITTGTVPLASVLKEMGLDQLPQCPSGGTYSLNPIGQKPTCSIASNETSSTADDHILADK